MRDFFSLTLKQGAIVLISRVLGYIRDFTFAFYIGSTIYSDVFIASFKLVNLFRTVFGEGAFNSSVVPKISSVLVQENQKQALRFASNLLTILIITVTIFTVIMIIFMPIITLIFTPGFRENIELLELTVSLSRLILPYLLMISITAFYGAIMQSFNIFSPFAATSIILNIIMIASN